MSQITNEVLTLLLDISDETEQDNRTYNFQTMKKTLHDTSNKSTCQHRLTSAAINRRKLQQQIEQENFKILARLQQIRPTRNLKRSELLTDYYRQMKYSIPPKRTRSLSHLR